MNLRVSAHRENPSVEIVKCISYQKFRYSGENRPGKKYQEKEFMTLRLSNLMDKVVRIVIICTDAENKELIHPNGLVGKDCHNGIYDKEYPVTKPSYTIKIPYLRTERIKTKKNESDKIQTVLQDRAQHLPSPYRERCLSQCTDKYTAARRFDTTKVCLGVIVTVSHLGKINGSLHAISHVVRNASEKTSLGILKLSQEAINANTGGEIDIFTTEDGPLIEPDKWTVFVTCALEHNETWASLKSIPKKGDILYKRVIRYFVPPCEPNPLVNHPVEAILHLECPQSNQYTNFVFTYLPNDDPDFYTMNLKRNYIHEAIDVKPCTKKLRLEADQTSIKANLKSKLLKSRSNVDYYSSGYIQQQRNDHILINPHMYDNQQVIVQHHNLDTSGQPMQLIDIDEPSECQTNNIVENDGQHIHQLSLEHIKQASNLKNLVSVSKGSKFQSNPPDVRVVAAGYSDAVPPDTTVLIYASNGGVPADPMTIDDVTGDNYVVEEVPQTNPVSSQNAQHNQPLREINNGPEVISGVSGKQLSQDSIMSDSDEKSQDSGNGVKIVNMSSSRFLIPNKKTPESSPWIVNDEEEAAEALDEVSGIVPSASNSEEVVKNVLDLKNLKPSESNTKQNIDGKESSDGLNSMGKFFVGDILKRVSAFESGSAGLDSMAVAEFANNLESQQPEISQSGTDATKDD